MRLLAVLVILTACDFKPLPFAPGDDVDAGPGIDAAPPITCGDLLCDPNAICEPNGPSCACGAGFTGDGMTCADVDECATDNGGCPGLCVNSPGAFACALPATCAEIKTLIPTAEDGPFRLYVDGNANEPWVAHCHDMAGTPLEYLTVGGSTFSQYTSGVGSPGTSVRTTYTRVRLLLDPVRIDIVDKTFATSTGMLNHSNNGVMVTSMPVATAMDCRGNNSNTGEARLDLTTTPFIVVPGTPFVIAGVQADGTANLSSGGSILTLTGGGACGRIAPPEAPLDPFNDEAAGITLPLGYDD